MQPTESPRPGPGPQTDDGPDPLSVLLVEDNPGDARLFEEYLEEYATESEVEVTLRHEETLEVGLEALGEDRPDVVVLDLGLPDSQSVSTVQRATAAAPPSVPIVVLTGQDDLEVALSAQQAGAAEYLRKEELSPILMGRTLRWVVQRSQMEARLRQRDAWIRSITESVSGGVFRVGATGRIEYANDALAGLLGFEGPEQLLGKDLTTFYAEPSARGMLLAKEGAETEEVEFQRRDGSTFTGLLSAQVARGEDGTPIHFDGFITDITERKQTERKLRESRERLANAQRIAGLGSWERRFDEEGTLYWSEETRRIFGWDPEEEVTYETFMEAVDPEDREALRAQQDRALEEGVPIDIEYRIRRPDGAVRILKEQGEAEFADDGSPVRLSGTVLDITERKAQENRLKVLSEAVQQAKEAVLITEAAPLDAPGPEIVYVNEACEAMTGYSEAEVLGKTPRIVQGPETERAVLDSLRTALEAGEEWEGETVNYRKDGDSYRVQWNVSPVRGEDGEIEYWVSVQRDVTEERERAETLRRQKHLLEQTQRIAGAWEVDPRTGDVKWSEEVYRIHELDPGTEVSLQEGIEFYAPEAREQAREAFRRCIEDGRPIDLEIPIVTAEGTRRWVRTVGSPSETKDGEVVKVAGAFQDITERKEAEQELRRSREQLSMAVEGGNIGTWNWDVETGEVIFNRQWAEMLGYSREELDFRFSTWGDLVHPEDLSRATEVLEKYVKGETDTYNPEIRMRTKSGDWKWIQTIGKVVERSEDGSAKRIAGIHLDIDERKRAEDALQEREAQLRGLANSIPGVVFQSYARPERTYGFHFVSEHAEEVLGIPRDPSDFFERCIQRVPDAEREALVDTINTAVDEAEPLSFEAPFVKPSGEQIWLLGTATPEPREDELIYNGVILDITERKRATRELEKREEQLRTITENVAEGIYRSVPGEGIVYANSAFVEMFGYDDLDEILEADPSALHADPGERELHMEALAAVDSFEGREEEFRRKDGTTFLGRLTGTVVRGDDGTVKHFDGAIADITEQKAQERRLSQIARRVTDAIIEIDSEWRFTLVNDQAEALIEMSEEDLLGDHFWDVFDDAIGTRFDEEYRKVMESRTPTRFEAYYSGLDEWFDVQVYPNDDGGLALYFEEITERKERERELREAKKEAEEAARLKSSMLANMSHEIRTPLTSMLGFSEILSEELEGELGAHTQRINRSGRRLMRTLDSMLELSRLEAGGYELRRSPVRLDEVVRETVELMKPQAKRKSITISGKTDGPVEGRLNEEALNRILENLVGNALKFTPEGGRVVVRAWEETSRAVLEVEDTGIGMDPDTVECLFEPFRQESEGMDREYEGTGLGLSIVEELVDRLGGAVEVETEKGTGTRITVRLPTAADGETEDEQREGPPGTDAGNDPPPSE